MSNEARKKTRLDRATWSHTALSRQTLVDLDYSSRQRIKGWEEEPRVGWKKGEKGVSTCLDPEGQSMKIIKYSMLSVCVCVCVCVFAIDCALTAGAQTLHHPARAPPSLPPPPCSTPSPDQRTAARQKGIHLRGIATPSSTMDVSQLLGG